MILSFVPRRGAMPKWPGKGLGQYPYIGRSFDLATRQNVADAEPAKCTAHGLDGRLTAEATRLAFDFCRRDGDLLPADAETAAFCSVAFVPLKRASDGEWDAVPKASDDKAGK